MFRLITLLLLLMIFTTAQAQTPITPENAAQLTFTKHIGGVVPGSLSWSPDGTKLAVGTSYETRVYDREALDEPFRIFPSGRNVAFWFGDDTLGIDNERFDLVTGEVLAQPGSLPQIWTSPGGRFTLTQDPNQRGNLTVTDTTGVNPETTWEVVALGSIWVSAFSSDEKLVAISVTYGTDPETDEPLGPPEVQLWSTESGERLAQIPLFYPLHNVDFSRDNTRLFILTYDSEEFPLIESILFDVANLTVINKYFSNQELISDLNGSFMGFISEGMLHVWNHGRLYQFGRVETWEISIVFSPDNQLVVVRTEANVYRLIWLNTDAAPEEVVDLAIKEDGVVKFSPDGRFLAAETDENQLTVWSFDDALVMEEAFILTDVSGKFEFSSDSSMLVVGNGIWDIATGEQITAIDTTLQMNRFTSNGKWVVFTDSVYNPIYQTEIYGIPSSELLLSVPSSVNFTRDGLSAAYWEGGVAKIVDFNTGEITEVFTIENFVSEVKSISMTANQMIVRRENELLFYDLASGEVVATVTPEVMPQSIYFSENGAVIASVYDANTIGFSATTDPNTELARITYSASKAALSPDGLWYAYGSPNEAGDGINLTVIDTQTGQIAAELSLINPLGDLYDLKFSPDGQTVLLGGFYSVEIYPMEEVLQSEVKNPQVIMTEVTQIGGYRIVPGQHHIGLSASGLAHGPWTESFLVDEAQTPVNITSQEFLAFSPDESLFLVRGLTLWDTASQQMITAFSGYHVSFSPDSTLMVVSTSGDPVFYSVAALREGITTPLLTLPQIYNPSGGVYFSSDGTRLYVQDEGGVSVWETSG